MLDLRHQHALSFLSGHLGDPLELELLQAFVVLELSPQLLQPLFLVAELTLAAVEVLALAVEVFLFLEQALFDLLRLCPVLPGFLFGGGADLDRLLLGFEQLFLGLSLRLGHDLLRLGCDSASAVAGPPLEVQIRGADANQEGRHQCWYEDVSRHVTCTSCIRLSKCGTVLEGAGQRPVPRWVGSMTGDAPAPRVESNFRRPGHPAAPPARPGRQRGRCLKETLAAAA